MRHQLKLACVAWTLVVWTQWATAANAAGPEGSAPKAGVQDSFRFKPTDPWLLVPVRLGNKSYPFVLDTGATGTIFDLPLRKQLGKPVKTVHATTPGGEVTIDLFSPPDARVGSMAFAGAPVACQDLSKMRGRSGFNFQGILGMYFLRNWIVSIDFDEGRVDFLPPGTPSKPVWGQSIPFQYDRNGMMVVAATAGADTPVSFVVDTGWRDRNILVDGLFSKLVDLQQLQVTGDGDTVGLGGKEHSQLGRLSHLSIGPFQHYNLRVRSGNKNLLDLDYLITSGLVRTLKGSPWTGRNELLLFHNYQNEGTAHDDCKGSERWGEVRGVHRSYQD